MKSRPIAFLALLSASLGASCGGDDPPPPAPVAGCKTVEQTGCAAGEVCEEVQGAAPACFKPVAVQGKVVDAMTAAPIAGALVVARDPNEAAVSTVATSAVDGTYVLNVPAQRDAQGKPLTTNVTLRADAAGYLTFPRAPRVALPVDLASATGAPLVVKSAATDIALIPLATTANLGSVSGKVIAPSPGGTLIVSGGATGIADFAGAYTLFNVPAGSVTISGFASGLQLTPAQATVAAGQLTPNVDLKAIEGAATATISGNVQIVNAPGGSTTSVVLAVEETFQEAVARGEVPRGLRAANVSGAFSIKGVPNGKYVVLAAFENDNLVRDPDTSIGGTEIVHIVVNGADQTISEGFKVTEALAVLSPGADKPEEISGTPVFQWADDSSEDSYEVFVFDALGTEIWKTTVAGAKGQDVSLTYAGPALKSGMYYQFRAVSIKDTVPISATEDLRGVFIYK